MKTLFLLPFAGGSSMTYDNWYIDGFNIVKIEYSGHGYRFKEPLITDFDEMLDDIIKQMLDGIKDEYVLFGHSMGGLLVWLLAHEMKKRGLREPEKIIISGCEPPEYFNTELFKKYTEYDEVVEYVRHFNRFSEKRVNSDIFKNVFFPVIRNDFLLASQFRYMPSKKLDIPLEVVYCREDSIMRSEFMNRWNEYANTVDFLEVKGDHFYIENTDTINILKELF